MTGTQRPLFHHKFCEGYILKLLLLSLILTYEGLIVASYLLMLKGNLSTWGKPLVNTKSLMIDWILRPLAVVKVIGAQYHWSLSNWGCSDWKQTLWL